MNNKIKFQKKLLEWYGKEARDLPWRQDPSPYKVWISEIMLQQTRVDTVISYFLRFIAEVPTIQDLAGIEDEKLLKLWQGLGYYNRALNLKRTAQKVMTDYNGRMPSDLEKLLTLPGIGSYTAGAIASIAYGNPAPAVDGNVLRIMARITGSKDDISQAKTKKLFESYVLELLPEGHPGDFNQALMDLGATICLPKGEPKCDQCPVRDLCDSYHLGLTSEIPVKTNKKQRLIEKKTVLVIQHKDHFAIKKREDGGLLPNLWEFPNFEGSLSVNQCRQVIKDLGISDQEITPLKPSKHIFSHREWHMDGYFILADDIRDISDLVWSTREELENIYSIPTAFKDFLKLCYQ